MHLKKTKKTPRMIRIIALMLSLVLVFFTMTGMAIAEEGTDVTDAAPDSTLEIAEAELELEPGPTEEPPAETPGAEETPEPMLEPGEPSIPPEPTDTPALEPEYELDADIPFGWHNTPVTITVRLIDKNETGWVKIEVAFSDEDGAERFDVTEEWNEYGYLERTMLDNGTVFFFVTDPMGVEHELFLDVYCMDFEAPALRAGINGTLLRVEASDALSGIAAVFVNDELYTTLDNGELNIRIDNLTDDAYLYIDALDNAGNWTDYVVLANPFYEEEPEPTPTPTPTPTPDTGNNQHDEHCPADCDCRKNNTSGSGSGSSSGGGSSGTFSGSGGNKNAGSSTQTPASSETPAPTTEPITKEDGTGFTQNGNSVTRDLLYDKYSNKQFITIETRNGETFYLVIDYDKPLDEDEERYETYFLNLVDEADLLALVEGDKQMPVCSCTTKCEAGAVNTSCEVCKTNMTECTGKEKVVEKVPEVTPEPEPEPEKKSSGGAVVLLLLLLLGGGGGALYWFKFRKKKPDAKGPVDLDDYDYGEDEDDTDYETEPDESEGTGDAEQEDAE